MITFVHAGDYLINLNNVLYIDLNPEPETQVLHVYFSAPDIAGDQHASPHIIELTDAGALELLRAIDRLGGSNYAASWPHPE